MTKVKQEAINKVTLDPQRKVGGYQFHKDSISNQLAYAFGGEDGEKKAKKILDEANAKYPQPLQMKERKKFIEDEINKRTTLLDENLRSGLFNIFDKLKDKKNACKGEEAEKDMAVALLKGLGLNVDADNVQTQYEPGPPQVFQITFVIKPTDNLKNEHSCINKLANGYSNKTRNEFNNSWSQHTQNANSGGPKIPKEEFIKSADKSFNETLKQYQTPKQKQTDNAVEKDNIEEDTTFKRNNS